MKVRHLPVLFIACMLLVATIILLILLVGLSHAQTAIIGPNGSVTYVYPGNPAVVINPNGSVSTIYPIGPPAPLPQFVTPPVVVLPPPPSFEWGK